MTRGPIDASDLHLVRGRYYDLRAFDHPGGARMIRRGAGTDVTAAVAAHHFTDAPYRALKALEVPAARVRGRIVAGGYGFRDDGFHAVLKRRVVDQLAGGNPREMRAATRPSWRYACRVAAVVALYLVAWTYCCFGAAVSWAAVCVAFLARTTLVGIGHESIHGRLPALFDLFGVVLCLPSEVFHDEHVIQHHPHTKREGMDPDEKSLAPVLRFNRWTAWRAWHVVQIAVQVIIAFCFSTVLWIEHTLVPVLMDPCCGRKLRSLATQTATLVCFQLLPFFTAPHDQGWLVFAGVVGLSNIFTLHAFHMSHINEKNAAVGALTEGMDWGEWQCRTSSNWDSDDWFSVTGMLEYQIEHHLFPSLPYAQQAEIQPLVRNTCAEFGVPYFEYSTGYTP